MITWADPSPSTTKPITTQDTAAASNSHLFIDAEVVEFKSCAADEARNQLSRNVLQRYRLNEPDSRASTRVRLPLSVYPHPCQ